MRPVLAHNLRLLRFIELHQPIGSARAFAAYDDAGENESAFRQRLSYLCKQGWLVSSGHTQNATWRLDPLRPLPTEAEHRTTRFLAAPTDINWGGKAHGGRVMGWMDDAAYLCAAGWSGRPRSSISAVSPGWMRSRATPTASRSAQA